MAGKSRERMSGRDNKRCRKKEKKGDADLNGMKDEDRAPARHIFILSVFVSITFFFSFFFHLISSLATSAIVQFLFNLPQGASLSLNPRHIAQEKQITGEAEMLRRG